MNCPRTLAEKITVLLATLAALAIMAAQALPQTTTFPIATAKLTWNWSKGTQPGVDDGDALGFKVRCGSSSKTYTLETTLADPAARSVLVRNVVKGSGAYYCACFAYNNAGDSPPSNEVFFSVEATPSSPASLTVSPK